MTDSLANERLDELDALAQAATPGKRHFQHWSSCALPSGDYAESILFDESSEEMTRGLSDADGEFIAAADPDTVRALITMARRAEEAISGAQWVDEQLRRSAGHVSNAEARVKAAESERDEAVHHAEIALARAAAANEKLEQVRALHHPVNIEPSGTICAECSNQMPNGRYLPTTEWPCPTVSTLDQTKEGE